MRRMAILALVSFCAAPAHAQLHLPQIPPAPLQLPQVPSAPGLVKPPVDVSRSAQDVLDPRNLLESRRLAVRELLRRHADVLEADAAGEPIVRGEVLLVEPKATTLDAARAAGFNFRTERQGPAGERIVVLRAPPNLATNEALERLRTLDAQAVQDFNHVYVPAGALEGPGAAMLRVALSAAQPPHMKIGLIDGGVDTRHPALRGADLRAFGCDGRSPASAHGTAVASLLVGRERRFSGAAPGATLYAADIYCDRPAGGSAGDIVEALAWLAREQVPVINVSLVGPANRVLEHALQGMIARGHLIVAAAGNDGPASPPLYPAAYPGVVAVTGVDPQKQVLPEAVRGPHIAFSAPGADMAVAESGASGFSRARGTSFAAPLVAGLLAVAYEPGAVQPQSSRRAIDSVIREAIDLGPPGRDPIFGYGLVGERLRVGPLALR